MLYLGEVVTMVLAEVAEPAGTREFGRFLLEHAQVFAPQKLDDNVGRHKLVGVLASQLLK